MDAFESDEAEQSRFVERLRVGWGNSPSVDYRLTRWLFLRVLALVYLVAFVSLGQQFGPLLGSDGLLPACAYLQEVARHYGSSLEAFGALPSLLWLHCSDPLIEGGCWLGAAVALGVLLGLQNAWLMLLLWLLYLSLVHVGQRFYGYGWEMLLLEAGLLAVFISPTRSLRPFHDPNRVPELVVVLLRWLVFRLMFGAGMIKLRGDACWLDLTCLAYHYETQPVPSPVSWLLHQLPLGMHKAGVLLNHFVELVVPFFVFGPRLLRHAAGVLLVLFQCLLIVSGNLSFLNWITLAVCLSCFDDGFWLRLCPPAVRERLGVARPALRLSRVRVGGLWGLGVVVGVLSVQPVLNMLSAHQSMNTSYDPLHLVNTYGAFGSVSKTRHEVVLQGTDASTPGADSQWLEYEFKCKPGRVDRRPCLITPYHYRLDWQMWFAALGDYQREPWLVHLVYKLLQGGQSVESLLEHNPFSGRRPKYVRAELYRYRFTRLGDETRAWWRRERVGPYLVPLSLDDPHLLRFLRAHGWPQ